MQGWEAAEGISLGVVTLYPWHAPFAVRPAVLGGGAELQHPPAALPQHSLPSRVIPVAESLPVRRFRERGMEGLGPKVSPGMRTEALITSLWLGWERWVS